MPLPVASCRDGQHSRTTSRGITLHKAAGSGRAAPPAWVRAIRAMPGWRATADGSGDASGPPGSWSTTPAKGVLLQHRALWSDQGGTWGLPGGALHQGEEAIHGALREAQEEAAVPPDNVRVLFTSVFDVGYWSYTTVVAEALEPFEAAISDPESLELQWVEIDAVGSKALHPGFAAAWPGLRSRLTEVRRVTSRP